MQRVSVLCFPEGSVPVDRTAQRPGGLLCRCPHLSQILLIPLFGATPLRMKQLLLGAGVVADRKVLLVPVRKEGHTYLISQRPAAAFRRQPYNGPPALYTVAGTFGGKILSVYINGFHSDSPLQKKEERFSAPPECFMIISRSISPADPSEPRHKLFHG